MTITTISDLHGYLPLLQPCDVVCICGDVTPIEFDRNTDKCIHWFKTKFLNWCSKLDCDKITGVIFNSSSSIIESTVSLFSSFISDYISDFNSSVYYSSPDYLEVSFKEGRLLEM